MNNTLTIKDNVELTSTPGHSIFDDCNNEACEGDGIAKDDQFGYCDGCFAEMNPA